MMGLEVHRSVLDAGLSVALVVSNRPGVRALEVAAAHGVPAAVLRRSDHADASERDAAIGAALAGAGVELAVLAGWDQLLRPSYFAAFAGRTINVHPSLLPAHGGAGMMGLEVHRSVLDAGDVETGVTIHDVTPATLDAWPEGDDRKSRVVFITRDIAESTIRKVFASFFDAEKKGWSGQTEQTPPQ